MEGSFNKLAESRQHRSKMYGYKLKIDTDLTSSFETLDIAVKQMFWLELHQPRRIQVFFELQNWSFYFDLCLNRYYYTHFHESSVNDKPLLEISQNLRKTFASGTERKMMLFTRDSGEFVYARTTWKLQARADCISGNCIYEV
jgi:hypothetical protein